MGRFSDVKILRWRIFHCLAILVYRKKKRRSQGTYLRVPMMELLIPWWTSNQKSMGSPAVNPPVGVGSEIWAPKKTHRLEQTAKGAEISSTQTNRGRQTVYLLLSSWPWKCLALADLRKNSCYHTSIKKMHPGGRIPSLITVHSLKVTAKRFAPETLAGDQKEAGSSSHGSGFYPNAWEARIAIAWAMCRSSSLEGWDPVSLGWKAARKIEDIRNMYWSWDWCNRSLVEETKYMYIVCIYTIHVFVRVLERSPWMVCWESWGNELSVRKISSPPLPKWIFSTGKQTEFRNVFFFSKKQTDEFCRRRWKRCKYPQTCGVFFFAEPGGLLGRMTPHTASISII